MHIPLHQLLPAAAAQAEAAVRETLLRGRGFPEPLVDAILQGRLGRRLGLMLSPPPVASVMPAPSPAPPVPQPALSAAQEKEKALKQMLFGGGGGLGGLKLGSSSPAPPAPPPPQQGEEDKAVARVLEGMAAEEAALAARRRTWKAPLLFERLRGSYEGLGSEAGGRSSSSSARPGAVALTRRLRALLYGLVGVQGAVREEVLLADDTCVWMDGWMDGWIDGWIDGWMDGSNNRVGDPWGS